jgi:N-acetylmuramic acid 6-phosphate etherase
VVTSDEPPQLDRLPAREVVELLLQAEERVVPALRLVADDLACGATILAGAVREGGRLGFAGAGTSGRLAAAEAAELPGTFGLPATRCVALVAGSSSPADPIDDAAEDDAEAGVAAVSALAITADDVVVAVAASGATPYTVAVARAALDAGAPVVAVVTARSSPLAALATVAIEAAVGDEVLRGSTRLTAGTAQKIALNTLTTTAMALAGRVHGNLMIDVVPANAKLRDRAAGIVAEIAGSTRDRAAAAIDACGGDARAAVVHLTCGLPPDAAVAAAAAGPFLRDVLDAAPRPLRPLRPDVPRSRG